METDIHSHLIPAVDDGVQDIETSLLFIQQLQEMGIQKVITTPHIMADRYPNSVQTLTAPYMQVKKVLQEKGIDLAFSFAGEYYMDEYFEQLISSSSLLTLQGKMVLVEMSFIQAPPQLHQWLFSLIAAGYQPVLAHPERYNHYHDNYTQYAQLKEWGCQLQMNLLSITGYYGKHVQKIAERLLADKMIDLVGTDMHHQKHLQAIKSIKTNKKAFKLLEGYNFKNKELTNT
ncbi:tyrosine-protein phosphatase [Chitinophaga japonensis]|nr:CpsB/CapC family capsule biosynthesis tyrosine phosphatase [Chitinophaga japonensis]